MIQIGEKDLRSLCAPGMFLDDERIKVLCAGSTCAVEAVPGSGKTTLVALKLCALLQGWTLRNRGVCVLSHTNVAQAEICRALERLGFAGAISVYPHYFGTIQRFADEYIAIPWLQSQGLPLLRISDEEFSRKVRKMICLRQFSQLRTSLTYSRIGDDPYSPLDRLHYKDGSLGIPRIIKAGPDTPTGKQLHALKNAMTRDGYFMYKDMFAIALHALEQCPRLAQILRGRFPIVLVDECQDNSVLQNALLHKVFVGGDSVIQTFGDANQAIYEGDGATAESEVPLRHTVTRSFRFGGQIASFASLFQTVSRCAIVGGGPGSQVHALLFDRSAIHRVFDAFGKIVASLNPLPLSGDCIRIVGHKRSGGGEIPSCIWDYVPGTSLSTTSSPDAHGVPAPWLHVLRALESRSDGDAHGACMNLLRCIGSLRRKQVIDSRPDLAVEHTVEESLRSADFERFRDWRRWFGSRFLRGSDAKETMSALADLFRPLDLEPTGDLDGNYVLPRVANGPNMHYNVQLLEGLGAQLGTIHGCKGETHDATLVLETRHHEFDISWVLDKIAEREEKSAKSRSRSFRLGAREAGHMRRLYVAVTRPRRLLCLAICAENLSSRALELLQRRSVSLVRVS